MKKLKKLFAVMLSLVMVLAMSMHLQRQDQQTKTPLQLVVKVLTLKVLALTTDRLSKKIADLHSDGSLQVIILQINL